MNSLSNQKLSQEKGIVKAVCLAGRYGKYGLLALLAVAYIATCLGAFAVARVAVVAILPIAILISLHIAVSEEVDA